MYFTLYIEGRYILTPQTHFRCI